MQIMNKKRVFTAEELQTMRTMYDEHGITVTRNHFQCGYEALARELGYKPKPQVRPSAQRIHALVKQYGITADGVQHIADNLGLSVASVRTYLQRYGIPPLRQWTHAQDTYLRMNAYYEPWQTIAEHLKRTVAAVVIRAQQLGIRKKTALGYTPNQLAHDLHMNNNTIHAWINENGLPATKTGKFRVSISESDVLDWLEAGNVLRLVEVRKCTPVIRAMREWADHTFIGSVSIANYLSPTNNKIKRHYRHAALLYTLQHGTVYHRSTLFPLLRDLVHLMQPLREVRTADDAYFAAMHASHQALYIHHTELRAICATTYYSLCRSGCTTRQAPTRGYWKRTDVVAHVQQAMQHSRCADVFRVTLQILQDDVARFRHVPHTWHTPPRIDYSDV